MRTLIRSLAVLLSLVTAHQAVAQQFPLTMPANTVYGRLGIGTGPGGAIPLSIVQHVHVVVYTVGPVGSTGADFTGDGAHDQVAINSAFTAATATLGNASVRILPGSYVLSAPAGFTSNCNGFYLEARGTTVMGPGGTLDTFDIANCNNAVFNFGIINAPGTGSAIHDLGGHIQTLVTWQALNGASEQGNGLYLDATSTGAAQSVNTYTGTQISNFNNGIVLSSTTNIDTDIFNVNFIYHNNTGINVISSETSPLIINALTWNVNIDASWSASATAFTTNEVYSFMNLIVASVLTGGANLVLRSGAANNIINCTPTPLCQNASILDQSGNATNNITAGLPMTVLAGTLAGHYTKFGSTSGNYQQIVDGGATIPTSALSGTLLAAQEPAHTGDCTNTAGSLALTCLKTNGVNFAALATQSPGTGVAAALGNNANAAGGVVAPVNPILSTIAPTIASGFCSSPSISNNNGTAAFSITIGSSCSGSVGVLTMPSAAHGWTCDFHNLTNPASNKPDEIANGATSVSVTNYSRTTGSATNFTAADVIAAQCTAY